MNPLIPVAPVSISKSMLASLSVISTCYTFQNLCYHPIPLPLLPYPKPPPAHRLPSPSCSIPYNLLFSIYSILSYSLVHLPLLLSLFSLIPFSILFLLSQSLLFSLQLSHFPSPGCVQSVSHVQSTPFSLLFQMPLNMFFSHIYNKSFP